MDKVDYISREDFLEQKRHLYCENCARRKNGKGKIAYEIGDAPCRACGIGDVLDDVEDFPAAEVRPVVLCRDCYAYRRDKELAEAAYLDPEMYCGLLRCEMGEDSFCSYGKRKGEKT